MHDSIDSPRFRTLLRLFPHKAIQTLYKSYYHTLLGISLGLTQRLHVAEDIVQDTFIHVLENSHRIHDHHEKSIQHYLVRIVRNKSITVNKAIRTLRHQQTAYLNGHPVKASQKSPEILTIERETADLIRQIIETFPPREKQCLTLHWEQDLTTKQIAKHLDISRKAVQRSITSAKKRLKHYWKTGKLTP
jgi:RNA polymerase sigma factor (sigma-70 family)